MQEALHIFDVAAKMEIGRYFCGDLCLFPNTLIADAFFVWQNKNKITRNQKLWNIFFISLMGLVEKVVPLKNLNVTSLSIFSILQHSSWTIWSNLDSSHVFHQEQYLYFVSTNKNRLLVYRGALSCCCCCFVVLRPR